jgi:structural maintenance of chromosome 4
VLVLKVSCTCVWVQVEQIAMMKPKAQGPHEDGLLEYLEDIIGSNKYVPQIEELAKEVRD